MKKIFAILALALSSSAFAVSYVSVDVENVHGRKGQDNSSVEYIRAGKEIGGIQYGLQGRTARLNNGGLLNSVEATAATSKISAFGITPFVGAGHDAGFNGARPYNYGLVGATTGFKAGPGFVLAGVKTRVGSTEVANTKQTVVFGTYAIPVTKDVAFNLNTSRSSQDIKETSFGVGLGFSF